MLGRRINSTGAGAFPYAGARIVSAAATIGFGRISLLWLLPLRTDALTWCIGVALLAGLWLCAWFAATAQYPRQRQMTGHALLWGLGIGLAAFLIGFAGPMIFKPEANQGPLLGVLYTGPLGFGIGTLLGSVIELLRRKPKLAKSHKPLP